jgi:hypothetical protein
MLEFIFSSLPSTMQQYQDLKLNPFKIRHCTTYFGLLGHHQERSSSGQLLCLACTDCMMQGNTTEINSSTNCNITAVPSIILSYIFVYGMFFWPVISQFNGEEHLQICSAAMDIEMKCTIFKFTISGSPGSSVARESVPVHMMTVSLVAMKPKRAYRHKTKSHHSHGHYHFHNDTS